MNFKGALKLSVSIRYALFVLFFPVFMNCAPQPTKGVAPKSTFATMQANYASSNQPGQETTTITPPPEFVSQKIELGVQPIPQCVAGEMDILKYSHQCATQTSLLITVMDVTGEKIVVRRSATRAINFNQLLLEITTHQMGNILGDGVDIFICIDGNNNGKCSDEPVKDINALSAKLAPIMKEANTTGTLTCDATLTSQLTSGVVLYYRHHQFRGVQSDQSKQVAVRMGAAVRSLAANDVTVNPDGTNRLRLQMVQYDYGTCPPPPQVRTDGCFARDTKIKTENRGDVQIDLLMPNEGLALSDGRIAKIKRIIAGPEAKPLYVFETKTGQKIRVTTTHPMKTERGVLPADQIKKTDKLLTENGAWVQIKKISRVKYQDQVYNVELEGIEEADHLVIANGLVSGDLYLQQHPTPKTKRSLASFKD